AVLRWLRYHLFPRSASPHGGTVMSLKNTSFRFRMLLLLALFLAGYAVTHLLYWVMVQRIRVKGPLYDDITISKDVINDLQPPTLPLRSPLIYLFQMLEEEKVADIEKLIDQFHKHEKEYAEHRAHWMRVLPEGPRKQAIGIDLDEPIQEYFK